MKIKVQRKSYAQVRQIVKEKHKRPVRQAAFWRKLMSFLSKKELKDIGFEWKQEGMEQLGKDEPALFLMNHSCFTDLQIAATLLQDRQYHIVMTNDGMVGKESLMRRIGCIPTRKFIADTTLIRDILYAVRQLNSSILMYPEASYSFDGTATPLPDSLGKFIRLLNVPVVMIRTRGAFLRDPLYNGLRKRAVKVSAEERYVLSPAEIQSKSAVEINEILEEQFRYDHFREQLEDQQLVNETFRAEGLERVLYKCPCCGTEDQMHSEDSWIMCGACGDTHELQPNGTLRRLTGETQFTFVPDWYRWERDQVKEEIRTDTYRMEADVDIFMLADTKAIYRVGEGHLSHSKNGFVLKGCDGQVDFVLHPRQSYSLYADYYWYEIGDMISIGDRNVQFYCFPRNPSLISVAKARLATEELYKHGANCLGLK